MATVRKATHEDISTILEMGRDMHAESPRFRDLHYSEQKVADRAHHLVIGFEGGLLVAEIEGKIVGMLAFFVGEHFFGRDKFAADMCVYVKPEHRGSTVFFRLVGAFEAWATALGVKELILGTSTGVNTDLTVRALQKVGYVPFSTGLLKKV